MKVRTLLVASIVLSFISDYSSYTFAHETPTDGESDREVLIELFEAFQSPDWLRARNWDTNAPLSDWYGVSIDNAGRVVAIDLGIAFQEDLSLSDRQKLVGQIPKTIGDLDRLETLNIARNKLSGNVPIELGQLTSLEILDLRQNELVGTIPKEIGELSKLQTLSLSDNSLHGPIPIELGKLKELIQLRLFGNHLVGSIPAELGDLRKLEDLHLGFNELSGFIPPELGSLSQLTNLNLYVNRLTGEIPATIGNLTQLTEFSLWSNELFGSIPTEIGQLSDLTYLNLNTNNLSGSIPPEVSRLESLAYLLLARNNLEGPLPAELVNLANVRTLAVSGNQLCLPSTSIFLNWLEQIASRDVLIDQTVCSFTDRAILIRLFEMTDGEGWMSSQGWEERASDLSGWHGIETDDFGRVVAINLAGNGLTGSLPLSLGQLSHLKKLQLQDNELSGRLPLSLARLPLDIFKYSNTSLCTPMDAQFQTWLATISDQAQSSSACESLSDRDVLGLLYSETAGENWTTSTSWLEESSLDTWHGVETDGNGRVVRLDLQSNALRGTIPAELSKLSELWVLNLAGNELNGPIPTEIGTMRLSQLNLRTNQLTGRIPAEIGNLSDLVELDLSRNDLNGEIPKELSNLSKLRFLDLSLNELSGLIPPGIVRLTNLGTLRLDYNGLHGEIAREIGDLSSLHTVSLRYNTFIGTLPATIGRLEQLNSLDIVHNQLSGGIPSEIGNLSNLSTLRLRGNRLADTLPAELGNLSDLRYLDLSENMITGAIPGEIGNLVELRSLDVSENQLSGSIPTSFNSFGVMTRLDLSHNNLEGSIPTGIGDLEELTSLSLQENNLSGDLPAELGKLSQLTRLRLEDNDLQGSIPSEFGDLRSLQELSVSHNTRMEGPIPLEMGELTQLNQFLTIGTDICLPNDESFHNFLASLYKRRIKSCSSEEPLRAYLVQAVQSHDYPVPLVAGRDALLRVFPEAVHGSEAENPQLRLSFHVDGTETHVVDTSVNNDFVQRQNDESELTNSLNVDIPGWVIQPGLELEIDVDPVEDDAESSANTTSGSTTVRIPIEVQELPIFNLTLVPFLYVDSDDTSIVDTVRAMAEKPWEHELLAGTRTLLPIGEWEVNAHEPITTNSKDSHDVFLQTAAIQAMEGDDGYYMGMLTESEHSAGTAARNGTVSFAIPDSEVIAHELGHNFSLMHAPCAVRGSSVDPSYPQEDGSLGSWGYDAEDKSIVSAATADVMSYCSPRWISDYHFSNALRYRVYRHARSDVSLAHSTKSLLVWGSQHWDGRLTLNPSFVVRAPERLPSVKGDYLVEGLSDSGTQLFSLRFDMHEVADAESSGSFVFLINVEDDWQHSLRTIRLRGSSESDTRYTTSRTAMSIIRNPYTNQIRGFLNHPRSLSNGEVSTIKNSMRNRGLDMQFSRGLPDSAAWSN